MHAGVTTVQVLPDDMEELVSILRESVVPAVVELGSMGTLVLTGRNIGKAVIMGFWESKAKANELSTSGVLQEHMGKIAHTLSGTANRQVYEVSLEVPGCATGESKCARFNFRQFSPDKLDEVIESYRESVVPVVGTRSGCVWCVVLTARDTGKLISMSLWESDNDMRASLPPGDVDAIVGGPPMRELYEVKLSEGWSGTESDSGGSRVGRKDSN